jgi:hypothetical protein
MLLDITPWTIIQFSSENLTKQVSENYDTSVRVVGNDETRTPDARQPWDNHERDESKE